MKTDTDLKQDVELELRWEASIDEAHIGVTAHTGIVTLTGSVPNFSQKYAAEKAVRRVHGVRGIADELVVKVVPTDHRSDEELAATCVSALKISASVPDESILVIVRDGWVALEGTVEWQFQKIAAEQAIRHLVGIRGITNAIAVRPKVSPESVKEKIEAALVRSAAVDAAAIRVEAHGGTITLHGRVRSLAERDEVIHAAWSAPGVTSVQHDLAIAP